MVVRFSKSIVVEIIIFKQKRRIVSPWTLHLSLLLIRYKPVTSQQSHNPKQSTLCNQEIRLASNSESILSWVFVDSHIERNCLRQLKHLYISQICSVGIMTLLGIPQICSVGIMTLLGIPFSVYACHLFSTSATIHIYCI